MDMAFDNAASRRSAVSWAAHNWAGQDTRNVLAELGQRSGPTLA